MPVAPVSFIPLRLIPPLHPPPLPLALNLHLIFLLFLTLDTLPSDGILDSWGMKGAEARAHGCTMATMAATLAKARASEEARARANKEAHEAKLFIHSHSHPHFLIA